MTEHPDLLLSAYLDDGLTQGEYEGVRAHLDGCARCKGRLAELRATSRLIGSLPQIAPRRSLVPRLERGPVWLRPVRLLGTMGTGVFVFLFIASAIIRTGSSLGGGTSTAEQLAAKGQFGAAANALASDAAAKRLAGATAVPANAPVPAAGAASSPQNFYVTREQSSSSAAPTTAVARADAPATAVVTSTEAVPSRAVFGPDPSLFLALAALCGIVAFVAHRRLRRS
jgi:anti-sigma factor RsiW